MTPPRLSRTGRRNGSRSYLRRSISDMAVPRGVSMSFAILILIFYFSG
jgi:hypothetical protein